MALFDIWVKKNKKVAVVKVFEKHSSLVENAEYFSTINSTTKLFALKQAEVLFLNHERLLAKNEANLEKVDSAIVTEKKIKEKKALIKPDVEKKAIYCDFNGVLDDAKREQECTEHNIHFRLPQVACPHKVMSVIKLAIKHNAQVVVISMHRLYGVSTYSTLFARCILNSDIIEYIDYYNDNEDLIEKILYIEPTPDLGLRTDEVRFHIKDQKYSHFVVFEDQHHIEKDLNLIKVNSWEGLTDKNIQDADLILSKPF